MAFSVQKWQFQWKSPFFWGGEILKVRFWVFLTFHWRCKKKICSFSESPRRARQKLVLQPMKFFSKKKIDFFFFLLSLFSPFPLWPNGKKKLGQKKFQKKNYGQSGVFFLGSASLIQIWNSKKFFASFEIFLSAATRRCTRRGRPGSGSARPRKLSTGLQDRLQFCTYW